MPGGCGEGRREAAPGARLHHETSVVVCAQAADDPVAHSQRWPAAPAFPIGGVGAWGRSGSFGLAAQSAQVAGVVLPHALAAELLGSLGGRSVSTHTP